MLCQQSLDKTPGTGQPITGSIDRDREIGQHAMAWLPTVLTIVRSMLTAVKGWVEGHAAPGAVDNAALDTWPLVRLLPDASVWKQLTAVVQLWLLPACKLLPPEGLVMVRSGDCGDDTAA